MIPVVALRQASCFPTLPNALPNAPSHHTISISHTSPLHCEHIHPPTRYFTVTTTMAVDGSTQTNGAPEPSAGQLNAQDVKQSSWTVESGMS